MSDSATIDLDTYQQQAREWIQANLARRSTPKRSHSAEYYTPKVMAENRALQRKLFDGGYAGITWPAPYGGQGLTKAHEEVFLTEAADWDPRVYAAVALHPTRANALTDEARDALERRCRTNRRRRRPRPSRTYRRRQDRIANWPRPTRRPLCRRLRANHARC